MNTNWRIQNYFCIREVTQAGEPHILNGCCSLKSFVNLGTVLGLQMQTAVQASLYITNSASFKLAGFIMAWVEGLYAVSDSTRAPLVQCPICLGLGTEAAHE